jgi:hypothetical protein
MIPAHMQLHFEMLSSAGWLAMWTVTAPGTQGVIVAGMQGCGVRTPSAAAVAAATIGLAMLMHMPNGMTLTIVDHRLVVENVGGESIRALNAIDRQHGQR